jgi:hypothetical protein
VGGADEAARVPFRAEQLTTTIAGTACSLPQATRDRILKVEELRSEVSVLHLINGLHLTEQQTRALLAQCREAKAIRDAAIGRMAALLQDAETSFVALKQELIKDAVRQETLDSAGRANEALKHLKDDYDLKMSELESQTNRLFTEEQQGVIRDFRPCVVPTKGERESGRVGQAAEPSGFVKVLEHLRTVPAAHLDEAKQRGCEMHFLRWQKHFGTLTEKEKAEVRKLFDAVVTEARAMSETKFEMSKLELAQRVEMPQSRKTRPRLNEPGKTANLLLDERVILILEAKLRR